MILGVVINTLYCFFINESSIADNRKLFDGLIETYQRLELFEQGLIVNLGGIKAFPQNISL